MNAKRQPEWPFPTIIIIFILINLFLFSIFSVCGDRADCIKGKWSLSIILGLDILFIARMRIASKRHEKSRDWIIYLIFIALSITWIPLVFNIIEKTI